LVGLSFVCRFLTPCIYGSERVENVAMVASALQTI
jgi:hypothetical protein